MSCSSPLYIRNKKTHEFQMVPCGHCYKCLTDKREMWSDRIRFDILEAYKQGCGSSFCTWTYSDDHYPLNGSLCKDDSKKFLRFVKREVDYHKIKVPFTGITGNKVFHYYYVGEYGGSSGKLESGRPHYHAIMIGLDTDTMLALSRLCWIKGFHTVQPAMSGSIRYVLKYLDKQSSDDYKIYTDNNLEPPFAFISHGIGKKYLEDNQEFIIENYGYRSKNTVRPIPYYYKKLLGMKNNPNALILDRQSRYHLLKGDYDLFQAEKALAVEQSYVAELRNTGKPADDSGIKYLKGLVSYLQKKQGV